MSSSFSSFFLRRSGGSERNLIGAQIISVLAFVLSLAGWWLAWISGLIVMIALWIACCVSYPRIMWMILAALSCIAAVGELLVLIGVVSSNFDTNIGNAGYIVIGIIAMISWLGVGYVAFNQGDGSGNSSKDLPR